MPTVENSSSSADTTQVYIYSVSSDSSNTEQTNYWGNLNKESLYIPENNSSTSETDLNIVAPLSVEYTKSLQYQNELVNTDIATAVDTNTSTTLNLTEQQQYDLVNAATTASNTDDVDIAEDEYDEYSLTYLIEKLRNKRKKEKEKRKEAYHNKLIARANEKIDKNNSQKELTTLSKEKNSLLNKKVNSELKQWFVQLTYYYTYEHNKSPFITVLCNKDKTIDSIQPITTDTLIDMSAYCFLNAQCTNISTNPITFKTVIKENYYRLKPFPSDSATINKTCATAWGLYESGYIGGIVEDIVKLNPSILEQASEMRSNAAENYLSGLESNTFELARSGVNLYKDPSVLKQHSYIISQATTAALSRFTGKAMEAIANSLEEITDLSSFIAIPSDAVSEAASLIMKPKDVLNQLKKDLAKDTIELENSKNVEKRISTIKSHVAEKEAAVQALYGDKLKAFNTALGIFTTTINQEPTWYINGINKLERQFENELLSDIAHMIEPILEAKEKFYYDLVDEIAISTVIPANVLLIKEQLELVRLLSQATVRAESLAKVLVEKAKLKILGIFGL